MKPKCRHTLTEYIPSIGELFECSCTFTIALYDEDICDTVHESKRISFSGLCLGVIDANVCKAVQYVEFGKSSTLIFDYELYEDVEFRKLL